MTGQLPQLLTGWTTVRKIGASSYSVVYEIHRQLLDETEKAALKVIKIPNAEDRLEDSYGHDLDHHSIRAHYRSQLTKIVQEYTTMTQLKGHPNIVCCDDILIQEHSDPIGWTVLIRMELLSPLTQSLDRICSSDHVIQLGLDICDALIECNDHDMIHRDIKPQNLFVTPDGRYKLGDFGVARSLDHTIAATKVGTTNYMAPEVDHGLPYGASADVYSLGLVLYWLLNEHRLPFLPPPPQIPTAEESLQALARRQAGEPLPDPKHGGPALAEVLRNACAADPKLRYRTPADFRKALWTLRFCGLTPEALPTGLTSGSESWPPLARTIDDLPPEETQLLPDRPRSVERKKRSPRPSASSRERTGMFSASILAMISSVLTIIACIALLLLLPKLTEPMAPSLSTYPRPAPVPSTCAPTEATPAGPTESSEPTDPTEPSELALLIPPDAFQFQGHSYKLYDDPSITTWEDAYIFCDSLGGYLAVIGSEDENRALFQYALSQGNGRAFFGYSDHIQEDDWRWVGPEKSTYTNWHVGQPNDRYQSDYAQFLQPYTGGPDTYAGWSDAEYGGRNGYAFLCEWPTLP